jgi:hypothetical protein
MLCFRDMTFCAHHADCAKGQECHRALTAEVLAAAAEWWRGCAGEPPICQFAGKPSCHAPAPA